MGLKFFTAIVLGIVSTQVSLASVPTLAVTFDTNVQAIGMNRSQEDKIQEAEEKIKRVIASEAFKDAVLNFTYAGKKQFNDNRGLTNYQIYMKILDGAEKLSPSRNNQMDLKIRLYYENSNTVGYTSSLSPFINMNTKYFNKYTADSVASNMTHEWLHKIGFGHAVEYSRSRDYTVPYAVGRIIGTLARKY